MITATWRPDFAPFYKNIDAQKVAEEIMAIGDEVTPEEVVNEARNPDSELHKCFEWNNDIAAEQWRKQQARKLFYHLIIQRKEDETKEQKQTPVRFFYNNDGKSYKTADVVFTKEDEYQKLLQSALSELQAFKKKYYMLQELSDILALIG